MTDKYDEMRERVYLKITGAEEVSDKTVIKAIVEFSIKQEDFNQEINRMFTTVQNILNNQEARLQHIEKYLSDYDGIMGSQALKEEEEQGGGSIH